MPAILRSKPRATSIVDSLKALDRPFREADINAPRNQLFFEILAENQLNSPLEPDNDHECRLRHRDNRIAVRLA